MQSDLVPSVTRISRSAPTRVREEKWLNASELRAFEGASTDAYRIYTGSTQFAERFGPDLLLSFQSHSALSELRTSLEQWLQRHQLQPTRIFARLLPRLNSERAAPTLLQGLPDAPPHTVVLENGLRFRVDFTGAYSVGLFIDQRANRAFLRKAGARHALNTFAYTCSFSVAAAIDGAATVSIDLSRRSLDRGRENFARNNLDPDAHRFLTGDVLEWLPRLARKGERFDAIVLDPPTFSRSHKGGAFQVERDFEQLLQAALEVAAPRAKVLLATNCTRISASALEAMARFALKTARRNAAFHREPPLPDFPPGTGAESLWLLLKD
jgi:23S rRNA (cytosine1962-C5)-methyltransferase